jgi:outer membrane usher protein
MPPRGSNKRAGLLYALALLLSLAIGGGSPRAGPLDVQQLYLEVYINDTPAHLIAGFTIDSRHRLSAKRSELREIGLKVPGEGGDEELVALDGLAGVAYRYDEPSQRIWFTLDDAARVTRTYDARGNGNGGPPASSDTGLAVNYFLFAGSQLPVYGYGLEFDGASLTLDGRMFSPYGVLNQSLILGTTPYSDATALRLDTTWSHSDPDTLVTYQAGDVISGGLPWTRPVRLGGVQAQRDFAIRPDLVTLPLPSIAGSAAVPSTIDVFVGNVKAYSQDVAAGPYAINNLPVLTGDGAARVVIRDATGRETTTSVSLFSSPRLLRPGLYDFSIEAGVPRLYYGVESNEYATAPVVSASVKAGISDELTLAAHAEGGDGLSNAGAGAVLRVGDRGVAAAALTGSIYEGEFGGQVYGSYETDLGWATLHLSSQRTFGEYEDVASVSAMRPTLPTELPAGTVANPIGFFGTTRPPRSFEHISLSMALPWESARLSLGYVPIVEQDGERTEIVSASYSQRLPWDASFYCSAFVDLADKESAGIYAGVSMSLADRISSAVAVSSDAAGTNSSVYLAKPLEREPGSFGWRIQDVEGETPRREVSAAWRGSAVRVGGSLHQFDDEVHGSAEVEGALAVMDGSVFLANRVDDAFAVVNAGAPDVEVYFENRPAGRTDGSGKLLVPGLRSYQTNKIAIDPRGLPLDAEAKTTQEIVAPADRSGVVVNFGVVTNLQAAVVVVHGADGRPLTVGAKGRLEGGGEAFVVGYDGQAYLKGLGPSNTIVVDTGQGECRASFPFAPQQGQQVTIGPVICR